MNLDEARQTKKKCLELITENQKIRDTFKTIICLLVDHDIWFEYNPGSPKLYFSCDASLTVSENTIWFETANVSERIIDMYSWPITNDYWKEEFIHVILTVLQESSE